MYPIKTMREIVETKLQDKKISSFDLIKKLGITSTYFAEILSGEKTATEDVLQRIAHFLSMNMYEKNEFLTVAALQKTPELIITDYIKKSAMLEIIKKGVFEIPEMSEENMKKIYSVKVDISKFVYEYVEEELKIKLDQMKDNFIIVDIIKEVMPYITQRGKKAESAPKEDNLVVTAEPPKQSEEKKPAAAQNTNPAEQINILPKINIYNTVELHNDKEVFKDIKDVYIMPHLENTGDIIGLKVHDTCMEPILDANSYAIIRKTSVATDGNMAVIRYNNQLLVRYIRKSGGAIFLMGASHDCVPIIIQNKNDMKIIGKVIKIVKDIK